MKLLQVDASPRRDSVSRQLTAHFAANWQKQFPAGQVVHRDLAWRSIPLINNDWIEGAFSSPQQHTAAHREALEFSDTVIAEAKEADVIVIGDPMHNFSISGRLKAWLDQLVRAGKTFSYGASGPVGLLAGKKVYVLTSRGGAYTPGTPLAGLDFQEPYLRHLLGFLGITDVSFIHAENQSRPELAAAAKAAAMQRIEAALL
ncbi:MAG TPA: NAD(P)H-dependent oxidoreductase [Candidatus Acidoferrum sp.]|nr:NAD(P)H-dependent oxidoreductase [Candidatus Acidoferrum sp.]